MTDSETITKTSQHVNTIPLETNSTTGCSYSRDRTERTARLKKYREEFELTKVRSINDWLCWSIFNLICGGSVMSFITVALSIICRSKKSINDYENAKLTSKLALIFNFFITIGTIIGWIMLYFLITATDKETVQLVNGIKKNF
ncbi:unnamed protein product [Rotaria sordida]|uniref:Interferon-induced transmembrane protein n=1 Tax=Rotaria sordida TaxID=392033 RepID=A0A818W518_9BILA|nr:unnamed protein product [Rotaria sordida]